MERARHKGYTLIELLVVMTIIVAMTSIAVPVLARGGLFSSDKSGVGAREIFAQLRAASLRARTSNMETAIAYDVTLVKDSLYDGSVGSNSPKNIVPAGYYTEVDAYPEVADSNWDSTRPVLTETLFVRRLTINELKETDTSGISLAQAIINENADDEYVIYSDVTDDIPFVPANAPVSRFETLPEATSILINHPSILQTTGAASDLERFEEETGLKSIAIFYVLDEDGVFDVRRVLPRVFDDDLLDTVYESRGLPVGTDLDHWNNRFPAHVFKRSGALDKPRISVPERIQLNVGLTPDADFYDRYMVDEDAGDVIFTNESYYGTDVRLPNDDLVAIDSEVTIFVPTGRVVLEGNDENT